MKDIIVGIIIGCMGIVIIGLIVFIVKSEQSATNQSAMPTREIVLPTEETAITIEIPPIVTPRATAITIEIPPIVTPRATATIKPKPYKMDETEVSLLAKQPTLPPNLLWKKEESTKPTIPPIIRTETAIAYIAELPKWETAAVQAGYKSFDDATKQGKQDIKQTVIIQANPEFYQAWIPTIEAAKKEDFIRIREKYNEKCYKVEPIPYQGKTLEPSYKGINLEISYDGITWQDINNERTETEFYFIKQGDPDQESLFLDCSE